MPDALNVSVKMSTWLVGFECGWLELSVSGWVQDSLLLGAQLQVPLGWAACPRGCGAEPPRSPGSIFLPSEKWVQARQWAARSSQARALQRRGSGGTAVRPVGLAFVGLGYHLHFKLILAKSCFERVVDMYPFFPSDVCMGGWGAAPLNGRAVTCWVLSLPGPHTLHLKGF